MRLKPVNSVSLMFSFSAAAILSAIFLLGRPSLVTPLTDTGAVKSNATAESSSDQATSTVSPQLLAAMNTDGNPGSLYTVTFQISHRDNRTALPHYSFQTSLADPDEPIIYSLNGEQISLDEFYAFQRELAKEQFLQEERRAFEAAEKHDLLLTVLDQQGIMRNDTGELIGQDFRTRNLDAIPSTVARLTDSDIRSIANLVADRGIKLKLYTESTLESGEQSLTTSHRANNHEQTGEEITFRELVFSPSITLFGILIGIYLITFRSFRQFRVM